MSHTHPQQIVVFSLTSGQYALPIEQVQEIIRYTEPRQVTSDAPHVRGVISLRGQIIPVIDLAEYLNLDASATADRRIVVAYTGSGAAGVIVDTVDEVLTTTTDQFDNAPGAGDPAITGIVKVDERLIVLLGAEHLLGSAAV